MSRNKTPVVIIRREKRLHRGVHLMAFALTGGLSAPLTAVAGASNAAYNARTRRLQREAEEE